MKCRRCGAKINDKEIARYLAAKGGRRSKRTLTRDQALAMVEAKRKKKAARERNKNVKET